jgi:hypothetical protein
MGQSQISHWNEERLECVIGYVKRASGNNDYPVVSVGSGLGIQEHAIRDRCFNNSSREFICVDNLSKNYDEKDFKIYPQYSTIEGLIHSKPYIINNCILLIFWPTPTYGKNRGYDIEAIELLQ